MENVEKKVKLTQKDYFNMLEELAIESGRQDLADFCVARKAQLEKKASASKETANQKANIEITEKLVNELANIKEPVTISDFQKRSEYASQFSNQKISALFKKEIETGRIIKTVDKKKSLFSVAE